MGETKANGTQDSEAMCLALLPHLTPAAQMSHSYNQCLHTLGNSTMARTRLRCKTMMPNAGHWTTSPTGPLLLVPLTAYSRMTSHRAGQQRGLPGGAGVAREPALHLHHGADRGSTQGRHRAHGHCSLHTALLTSPTRSFIDHIGRYKILHSANKTDVHKFHDNAWGGSSGNNVLAAQA